MIAQGNGEKRETRKDCTSFCFFGKCLCWGRGLHESVDMACFIFFKLVSCFPLGPHLFCYLPHHLLLLFIVYLPNEGGGVDWGLIDSDKPLQSGQRAVGFGFKSALNVRLGPVFIKPNCCSS